MTIQDEQLIYDYLGRVADAAQGRLAPLDRVQLVEDVRLRIESERQRGGPIPRILAQLGSAELLVARTVGAGWRAHDSGTAGLQADDDTMVFPDSSTTPVDQPAGTTGPAPYTGLVAPTVTPVPGTGGEREGPAWRRGMLARADRSWRPAPLAEAPSKATALVRGRNLVEIGALLFYTIGSVLISYIGFLVAVGLTLLSKVWNDRDKAIAIAVVPALTLGTGVFIVWLTQGQDRSGSTDERFDRAMSGLGDFFKYWPWVAGFLSAGYLLLRLLAERRRGR